MTDREITLATIEAKEWEIVRLRRRDKRPDAPRRHPWPITKDPCVVGAWLDAGHNVGLVCHQRTRVLVIDPDKSIEWADMIDALGQPCLPWVITGSGRLHYYVEWTPDLPAKITWNHTIVGEIQRGPGQQQVVMPPSIHPETGVPYTWITSALDIICEPVNPVTDPLPKLPGLWLAYLRSFTYVYRD